MEGLGPQLARKPRRRTKRQRDAVVDAPEVVPPRTTSSHPDAPTPAPADPASPRKAKAKRRRKQPDGAADPPVGEDGPQQKRPWAAADCNFPDVVYGDHFETSFQAIQDLAPVLRHFAALVGRSPADLTLYDPYYCDGAVKGHLARLGFGAVRHENRDFYEDVRAGQVPSYDLLLTNPPYSADHKERAVEFCCASGKPWALLLPNYVATKAYYQAALRRVGQQPIYLVPTARYEFAHPEGTGHTTSPFRGFWFLWLGPHTPAVFRWARATLLPGTFRVVASTTEQLVRWRLVPQQRLNPQRRRLLLQGKGEGKGKGKGKGLGTGAGEGEDPNATPLP
eukprot:EG_transcript_15553